MSVELHGKMVEMFATDPGYAVYVNGQAAITTPSYYTAQEMFDTYVHAMGVLN